MADLKTTFAPDKSMVVSTPGASAPAFPELTPDLINALIGRRAAASSPAPGMVNRGRRPSGGGSTPSYTPSMGQAQPQQEIKRYVPDPFASPYHKMATGQEPGGRWERYIDGKWEFADLRPQGSSGGIVGGGNPDLSRNLPAAYDPRMLSLVGQSNNERQSNFGPPRLLSNDTPPASGTKKKGNG